MDRTRCSSRCALTTAGILPALARDIVLEHSIQEHGRKVFFYAIVVMPEHVHFLLKPAVKSSGEAYSLGDIMDSLRGPSAHAINKALGRHGRVWQRDFFDRLLREGEFNRYMNYICGNPQRRGLVHEGEEYPWLWIPDVY
jgi:REP element-mobilizing transposase RayT